MKTEIYVNWDEQEVYNENEFKNVIKTATDDLAKKSIDLNDFLNDTYVTKEELFHELLIYNTCNELYEELYEEYTDWLCNKVSKSPLNYGLNIEKCVIEI